MEAEAIINMWPPWHDCISNWGIGMHVCSNTGITVRGDGSLNPESGVGGFGQPPFSGSDCTCNMTDIEDETCNNENTAPPTLAGREYNVQYQLLDQ